MPLNIITTALIDGTDQIPYYETIKSVAPFLAVGGAIKYWSRGTSNIWERQLHGKVYIVTGATSQGMGTSVILKMASLGAQLIILTRTIDEWSTEWCNDLRDQTKNQLIYLEKCDLGDLWAVRKFVTGWLDNSPPRRLDGVLIMSGDMEPCGIPSISRPVRKSTEDGLEIQIGVNFVGVFHLIDLLQPSFKVQPPDRDVRIIYTTCWLQSMGKINLEDPLWQSAKYENALKHFASSKLQMGLCLLELQRRLFHEMKSMPSRDGVERTGKNVTFAVVQPGTMRSLSLRRVLSNGSIVQLVLLYCTLLYPFLWLFTKSGDRGGQSVMHAVMSPELEEVNADETNSVKYISECSLIPFVRKEFHDSELQKTLFDSTKKHIEQLEKKLAVKRNADKKKR